MAITPLPAVPLRSDAPATFVTKADAFLGALNLFATEVDAVGVALTLGATNATSTTSLLIGLGSKSLTVQTGKSYVVGMTVKIASTAVGSTWMLGDITSYTTGTGALVVTVTSISGSGTLAAWTISQSAPGGAKVGVNSDITSLTALDTSILNIGSGQLYKDASGNVGIGTSIPTCALQITDAGVAYRGQLSIDGGVGGNAQITLYNGPTTGTANLTAQILTNTDNVGVVIAASQASGYLVFRTNAGSERMKIDSAGNVGIGNSLPTTKLDVTGTVTATTFSGGTVTATTFSGAGTGLTGTANSLNAGLGVNQTWQIVTGSRAIGTTYTNSTGKPITVAISYTNSTANTVQGLVIAGTVVYASGCQVLGFGSGFSLVVPNGATYVTTTNIGTMTLVNWVELR